MNIRICLKLRAISNFLIGYIWLELPRTSYFFLVHSKVADAYFYVSKTESRLYEKLKLPEFKEWYLKASAGIYTAYRLNGHRLGGLPDLSTKLVVLETFTRHDELLQLGLNLAFGTLAFQSLSQGVSVAGCAFAFLAVASVPFTFMQRYNRSRLQTYFDRREGKGDTRTHLS